jgi:hypothetical protein
MHASWKKAARHYRVARVVTKRAYKSFVGRNRQGLALARQKFLAIGPKTAKQYRRAHFAIRLAYKNLVDRCRQDLDLATRKVIVLGLKTARQYRRVRFATRQAYKLLVDQCHQSIEAAKQKAISLSLKTARQYRRARFATRQAYKNLVDRCRQDLELAMRKVIVLGLKTARQYRRARFAIRQACKNLVDQCQQSLEAARQKVIVLGPKTARHYRRAHFATRQAYKNLVDRSRQDLDLATRKVIALGLRTARQYRRVRFATRQAYKLLVDQCHQSLEAAKQKVVALGLKTARQYRGVRYATRQAYKNLVDRCRQDLDLAKQKVIALGLKTVRQSHRVSFGIIQAFKNCIEYCRQRLHGVKQQAIATGLKSIRHYRSVRFATRQAYKNWIVQCRQDQEAAKLRISKKGLRIARHYRGVLARTRRAYRNIAGLCHRVPDAVAQQLSVIGLEVGKFYRRIHNAARQAVRSSEQKVSERYQRALVIAEQIDITSENHVEQDLKAFAAKRERMRSRFWRSVRRYRRELSLQMHVLGVRIARKYLRALVIARRTYRNFVDQGVKVQDDARRVVQSSGQNIAGQYRGVQAAAHRMNAVSRMHVEQKLKAFAAKRAQMRSRFWRSVGQYCRGLKLQIHVLERGIARKYLRTLVIVRRTYRNLLGLCRRELATAKQIDVSSQTDAERKSKAFAAKRAQIRSRFWRSVGQYCRGLKLQIHVLERRIARKYCRTLVILRRTYRNLRQRWLATTKQIDISSQTDAERNSQAFAAAREQMTSSWLSGARQCRRGLADIGQWISSSIRSVNEWASELESQEAPVRVSDSVKKSPFLYQHRRVNDSSRSVPPRQMGSFFSQFTAKLPLRGRIKTLKSHGLKPCVDMFLIVGVALYVLLITYFVANKYKYINPFNSPGIALGGLSAQDTSVKGNLNNRPPLALIAYSPQSNKVQNGTTEKSKGYSFWPKRVTLRHVEGWGEGVSFGTDYSTIAMLFAPDYRVGRVMPMVDLRGHRFDNNSYAANIGIAGRYIPSPNTFCQVLGLNLFYDWRQGSLGDYQQIGAGLEVLGKRWDLRANVYAPFSVKQRKMKCVFDEYEGGYIAIHRRCEFTSYGYNAEVGYYIIRGKDFFLYAAGGPYYLVQKCHDRTGGGEFRIRPQYKDYLALDFSVSHDNVFGTVYQAQVILYLPLYQLSKHINKRPCNISDQQIYQPIERFEVMPLGRRSCWQTNF